MTTRRVRHILSRRGLGAVAQYHAGVISGLADGDPVSTWADISGNGIDITAASTVRPVYKTGIRVGHSIVRLDGSNDVLSSSATSALALTAMSFVAVKSTVDSPFLAVASSGTLNQEFLIYDRVIYHHRSASNFRNLTHPTTPSTWHIQSAVFGMTSTDMLNALDGVSSTSSQTQTGTPVDYTSTNRAIYLGRRGNTELDAAAYAGDVAFVAIFPAKISDSFRKRIEHAAAFLFKLPCS